MFGATLWGSTEDENRPDISLLSFPAADFNTHALKSSGYRVKGPKPGPIQSHTVRSPYEASDAGPTYLPTINPSRYNTHMLKSSGPVVSYPYGDGPITEDKAIAMLEGKRVDAAFKPLESRTYTPLEVREILKLLAEGDLSEEQLDAYAEDDGRLRTYAAAAKQRALTVEEQAAVDEIGRRLDAEAASLAREDVGYVKDKRNEIEAVDRGLGLMAGDLDRADRSAMSSEVELNKMESALATARADEAKHDTWLRAIATSAEYKRLEDEETKGWPSAATQGEEIALENRLESIRKAGRRIQGKIVDAQALIVQLEHDIALVSHNRDTSNRDASDLRTVVIPRGVVDAEAIRLRKRNVNPRFGRPSRQEMPQLVDAIEVSRLPDAAEDKTSDYDFALAIKSGAVDKFLAKNAISHGLSTDTEFISNPKIISMWEKYRKEVKTKDPAAKPPKRVPWPSNRRTGLKAMVESGKIPSEFMMRVLRKTGFA